jgi:hypothetical protein
MLLNSLSPFSLHRLNFSSLLFFLFFFFVLVSLSLDAYTVHNINPLFIVVN